MFTLYITDDRHSYYEKKKDHPSRKPETKAWLFQPQQQWLPTALPALEIRKVSGFLKFVRVSEGLFLQSLK